MTEQELKWWHVRWRLAGRVIARIAIVSGKILGSLCLVAAVGYGVVYLISPWLESRGIRKFDPRVSMVPVDLPSRVEAPLSGASIDCYGFRFRLPNEAGKTVRSELITLVPIRDAGMFECGDILREPGMLEFAMNDKQAQRLLGEEVLRSKFSLMQAAMKVTPEKVKWWRFRALANERAEYLLITKSLVLSQLHSLHSFTIHPIYEIASGGFRGFQVGNPEVTPYEAHVDLFDTADRHVEFDVTGQEGHGQVLTQLEINAIVASIQPTPGR